MAKGINLGRQIDADENGSEVTWPGGDGTLHAGGTWNGATITLQYKPVIFDTSKTQQWASTDVILTESVPILGFSLGAGSLRYVTTSTGGSTDLDLTATKA